MFAVERTRHSCYDKPTGQDFITPCMEGLRDCVADSTAIESRIATVITTIAAAITLKQQSSPASAAVTTELLRSELYSYSRVGMVRNTTSTTHHVMLLSCVYVCAVDFVVLVYAAQLAARRKTSRDASLALPPLSQGGKGLGTL